MLFKYAVPAIVLLSNIVVASGSGGVKVSPAGQCGSDKGYTCLGYGDGQCCSKYGYCGKTNDYCGNGCQGKYGLCGSSSSSKPTSSASKASASSPPVGSPSACPSGYAPVSSGPTRVVKVAKRSTQKISTNGRCGSAGSGASCLGSSEGSCCSQYNYCGNGRDYCGKGCQPLFGSCNGVAPSGTVSSVLNSSPSCTPVSSSCSSSSIPSTSGGSSSITSAPSSSPSSSTTSSPSSSSSAAPKCVNTDGLCTASDTCCDPTASCTGGVCSVPCTPNGLACTFDRPDLCCGQACLRVLPANPAGPEATCISF